jgi:hypothetical protein
MGYRAFGSRLGAPRGVADVSPATSAECIDTLWQLGFAIVDGNEHFVWLERERDRRLFIERNRVLSPEAICVMLGVARVSVDDFVATLELRRAARELGPVDVASSGVRRRGLSSLPARRRE